LGKPTIGVAKSRLIGETKEVGKDIFLFQDGEIIGAVLRTIRGAKPVYVSVGNMISLETASRIVKNCVRGSRAPEPIRTAHALASSERKAQIGASATS
jgi:deoxyribonuclease V